MADMKRGGFLSCLLPELLGVHLRPHGAPNILTGLGENQQSETCPFTGSAAERDIVLSTNDAYLKEMRINPLAPAANMRRITPPHEKPAEGERFVSWSRPRNELADAVTLRKETFLPIKNVYFTPVKEK